MDHPVEITHARILATERLIRPYIRRPLLVVVEAADFGLAPAPLQIVEVKRRVAAGEQKARVARDMGISRETVYQYLRLRTPGHLEPTGG